MPFLNAQQQRTLALFCDTLVPVLQAESGEDERLYGCGALQLAIPAQLEDALLQVGSASERRQMALFLTLIENPLFTRLTARQWQPFSRLPLADREAALRAWAASPLPIVRRAFQVLKRLTLFLFYANMPADQNNPTWVAFNYSGPPPVPESSPRPIRPLVVTQPTTLYTDVLVVGSGAGGGVVAGELTAAGLDVIVVEKGGYYAEADVSGAELRSQAMFEKSGMLTSADVSVVVLAGSVLGGGTTINWAGSIRTPDDVLQEWERQYGFSGVAGPEFQQSLDAISARINVNTLECHPNPQNAIVERGCQALGYDVTVMPRNVKGCEECGFCNFGCRFGAKQSTLKTYLQDAFDRGARILVRSRVERISHQRGHATGAHVKVQGDNGAVYDVTVNARAVVAAAGTVHTPALLLRSGLGNANIGANLHLHPTTVVYGLHKDPVRAWEGPPMTRYCTEFTNLDGRGYGVRLETAPVHPGIAALSLPWQSGRQHKRLMQQLDHLANTIILTRDYYGGRVSVDSAGNPVLRYQLSRCDAEHMMRGTLEALRVQRAAGAVEVSSPHNAPVIYRNSQNDHNFEAYLEQVQARGFESNTFALFSAHQMSSCRAGGDSARGAVDPTGESYELRNLFVADGSVLPTASGVNPMLTIMATAHFIARHIKSKL